MKRALVGMVAALGLVASQAAAGANSLLTPTDRAGSSSETASEMMGYPAPLLIFFLLTIALGIAAASDDGPSSP